MKKEFVTYEIAKRLKELGFNEPCFTKFEDIGDKTKLYPILCTFSLNGPYENEYHGYDQKIINDQEKRWNFTGYKNSEKDHGKEVLTAPLWQQAINWLRENHKIFVGEDVTTDKFSWRVRDLDGKNPNDSILIESNGTETYEQTREAAIIKALELIK